MTCMISRCFSSPLIPVASPHVAVSSADQIPLLFLSWVSVESILAMGPERHLPLLPQELLANPHILQSAPTLLTATTPCFTVLIAFAV